MACRKLRRQKKRKRERFSSLLPTSTASVCLTCTERRRRGIWVVFRSKLANQIITLAGVLLILLCLSIG
ncbi:hypothetical protein ABKV19_014686 [Rosa sericea]